MLRIWAVTIDYLRLRSTLATTDRREIPSIYRIAELIQEALGGSDIPAVLKRRDGGGYQLKSKDVDIHVLTQGGFRYVDLFCHVDALELRPRLLHERIRRIHERIASVPGLDLGRLQVAELHLAVTFSGGRIGARSIRRIGGATKLKPEPAPYYRGECYLYNKTTELKATNKLRKQWILAVCREAGYRPDDHGPLWRLEFRLLGERITELGYPDLPMMWRNLLVQYPLMRYGSKRGKGLDPAWKRLAMAAHTWPWDEPLRVWHRPTVDPYRRNRARGMFEHTVGVLLEDVPVSYTTAGEAVQEVVRIHYPSGSPNERDLLDMIKIQGQETDAGSLQLVFSFMDADMVTCCA